MHRRVRTRVVEDAAAQEVDVDVPQAPRLPHAIHARLRIPHRRVADLPVQCRMDHPSMPGPMQTMQDLCGSGHEWSMRVHDDSQ